MSSLQYSQLQLIFPSAVLLENDQKVCLDTRTPQKKQELWSGRGVRPVILTCIKLLLVKAHFFST